MKAKIISQNFFDRPTLTTAKRLLGKYLVRRVHGKRTALMITEVEAYDGPRDKASHASRGETPRTKIMFGEAGRFYVYFTYGMHWILNIVTGAKGYPAAVLLRAGLAADGTPVKGPARLAKYMEVDKKINGKRAIFQTGLWFEDRGNKIKPTQIVPGKRIGVEYAGRTWANKKYNFKIRAGETARQSVSS